MAEILKDEHDHTKNEIGVTFQVGRVVVGDELNCVQDNANRIATDHARAIHTENVMESFKSAGGSAYVTDDGWQVTADGTSTLTIKAGAIYVDGFRVWLNDDTEVEVPNVGTVKYGLVYADIEVQEVSDADVIFPVLGETTVRKRLVTTINITENTTDYPKLVSDGGTLPDLPAIPGGEVAALWQGNVARVVLARYHREAGSTVTLANVVDLRQKFSGIKDVFLKNLHPGDGNMSTGDGFIVWSLDEELLTLGVAKDDQVNTGILIRQPGGPDLMVSAGVDPTTYPTLPTALRSFQVGAGMAVGYVTRYDLGSHRQVKSGFQSKMDTNSMGVYSATRKRIVTKTHAALTSGVREVEIQTISVAGIDEFRGASNSFILCARVGNDLIWRNGDVTRGKAGTNNGVPQELGHEPSRYRAVISKSDSDCHFNDLVQALNFMTEGAGAGAIGDNRNISLYLRGGTLPYPASGLATEPGPVYGNSTTNGTAFELTGDGPENTRILLAPKAFADRDSNPYELTIVAEVVKLSGLHFDTPGSSPTNPVGWTVLLGGTRVVVENCKFTGPITVTGVEVVFRNCEFNCASGVAANGTYISFTGVSRVADHVAITATGSALFDNCVFNVGETEAALGSVIPETISNTVSYTFRDCRWVYTSAGYSPSVLMPVGGKFTFDNCKFRNAQGALKNCYRPADGTWPWTNNLKGVPLSKFVAGASTTYTNPSYIAMPAGRMVGSETLVRNCHFDMTKVGVGRIVDCDMPMWGAVIGYFSTLSAGDNPVYSNIHLDDNFIDCQLTTKWGLGFHIAVWGFWISPSWQDDAFVSVNLDNITMSGNRVPLTTDITDLNGVGGTQWRSLWGFYKTGETVEMFFLETTSLFGARLKNVLDGTVAPDADTRSGRTGVNVEICDNKIWQNSLQNTVTLTDINAGTCVICSVGKAFVNTDPLWSMTAIILDGEFFENSWVLFGDESGPIPMLTSNDYDSGFISCRVDGNTVNMWNYANYPHGSLQDYITPLISVNYVYQTSVDNNKVATATKIDGFNDAVNNLGVAITMSGATHFNGNITKVWKGWHITPITATGGPSSNLGAGNFASNNFHVVKANPSPIYGSNRMPDFYGNNRGSYQVDNTDLLGD